ncbi:hypothetical protein F5146DRAFT_1221889, partial [Armillaria mellea]
MHLHYRLAWSSLRLHHCPRVPWSDKGRCFPVVQPRVEGFITVSSTRSWFYVFAERNILYFYHF